MTEERLATLEAAAKAGKRSESDYGQSSIRRINDQMLFERECDPAAVLELIAELHRLRER